MRIPITKHMPDGSVIDGTALLMCNAETTQVSDFRGLDGEEMPLEAGACFKIDPLFVSF